MNYVHHESYSDANFYLSGSLIKVDGQIGYVNEIDGDGMAYLKIGYKQAARHYDELDLSPIDLGYVFSPAEMKTLFIERMPRRQWRQGLTADNTRDRLGSYLEFSPVMDYFKRTITGRFPKILRALRLAVKTGKEIPFSRDYAISSSGYVFFKTIHVGSFDKATKKFTVLENYFFLEKELEEYVDVYNRFL